jgi:hypothetical protein
MNRFAQPLFIALLVCSSILGLSSCDRSSQTSPQATPTDAHTTTTPTTLPDTTPAETPTATPTTSPATDLVTVNVYGVDSQCEKLVPREVQVPRDRALDAAIGKVLQDFSTVDFPISGYRVKVDGGIATIDLRLPPNALRKMTSLSSCEQFALFGSLRETLMQNSDWGIQSVKFTERGEEIVF